MTDPTTDDRPPGVRVLTDGGTEQTTKTKTVTADAVVERTVRDDDDEEREVLRVPISSTRQDRDGDAFSREALEDAAEQIRQDSPMVFDDHGAVTAGLFGGGYSARETIGTQFDAEVEEDGDEHATLYAYINPDGTHEEGSRMLKQVRDEMQAIKFSVGFRILKSSEDVPEGEEPDRANEIPGRLFMRTDLMETSRVGIPANPDASASVVAKDGVDGTNPRVALAAELLGVDAERLQSGAGMVAKTDGGQTKEKCDADADCPEDEVCVNGECVPEDSVEDGADDPTGSKAECPECGESVPDDANYCPNCGAEVSDGDDGGGDDDDEEGSASADGDTVTREEFDELKAELKEAREALSEGRGEPESANTDTTKDQTPTDDEAGETTDADDEGETKAVPQTALERAGSN